MKQNEIAICICDPKTKTVTDQIDKKVPDIFNTFDVCDLCEEQTNCESCIVRTLQIEQYFVESI